MIWEISNFKCKWATYFLVESTLVEQVYFELSTESQTQHQLGPLKLQKEPLEMTFIATPSWIPGHKKFQYK